MAISLKIRFFEAVDIQIRTIENAANYVPFYIFQEHQTSLSAIFHPILFSFQYYFV